MLLNITLAEIPELFINIIFEIVRWIIPILAFSIVFRCLRSLFRTRTNVSTMAVLVNPITKDELPLVNWENSVGRSKQCDVVLNYPTVSHSHAVIYKGKNSWKVADTGSKTGVYVNGEKIDKKAVLNNGDTVLFGTVSFIFQSYDTKGGEVNDKRD